MPLILGANSVSGGYEIDNSLRFNHNSSDYLSRTPASAGNRRTFTFSFWTKRSEGGSAYPVLFDNGSNSSNRDSFFFNKSAGDFLQFYCLSGGSVVMDLATTQLFRDFSAWYHIVLAVDTTQATDSNRVKLYVNGSQVTAFQTATYISQNTDMNTNSTNPFRVGGSNSTSYYHDGYMSEVYFIDGTALTPSSFGETDEDTNIWIPKAYTGSFGTNGFYLEFQNSGALGTDSSGNGNTFTVNNLTSIDQTTDTPTNNFATMNSLVPATSVSFSNGNLTFTGARAGNWSSGVSTIALNSGKWYAEFKMDSTGGLRMVAVEPAENISDYNDNHGGHTADGRGYEDSNGYLNTNGGSSPWGNTYGNGDIIGVALDMDNRYVYFSKNGVFQNSGVPTSGSSGTGSAGSQLANKAYYFVLSGHESSGNTIIQSNFGNPPFTISSGNADANGYGNFEYAVPSGYYSLCTKNLAEYA
jgi:hypothetical protein